jgi:transposase
MAMGTSLDLRRRLVAAYRSGRTATYEAAAEMFGVGRATVSRMLRRERETGDVQLKPRGGNRKRVVDDAWLIAHAIAEPDARLIDRVVAWKAHSSQQVSVSAMHAAMQRIGWTHKKRRRSLANATPRPSKHVVQRSSRRKQASTRIA